MSLFSQDSLNPLFAQAKASKVKLNVLFTILLYFVIWLAGLFLGRFIFITMSHFFAMDIGFSRKWIVCGTQIALFFAWVKGIEKRPVKTVGLQAEKPVRSYVAGMIVGFGAITLITLVLYALGMVAVEPDHAPAVPLIIIAIASGWVVQSASEEIAIRGWLIPALANGSSPVAAIALTSLVFGILHLFSSGVTVLSFINLILSGVFFAGYAIRSKHIWGVCGMHFAWNFTLGNLYGFPVSGFAADGPSFLAMKLTGSTFFTGGAFGPEGGFVTTVILAAGIGILAAAWPGERSRRR